MPAGLSLPHRRNKQITIVAGTPVRLADVSTLVTRLFIQSLAGNTGLVYVLDGVPADVTLDATLAAQLTAQLGASTGAAQPGGAYGDPPGGAGGWNQTMPVDLNQMGIDGNHSGDVVLVSWVIR